MYENEVIHPFSLEFGLFRNLKIANFEQLLETIEWRFIEPIIGHK